VRTYVQSAILLVEVVESLIRRLPNSCFALERIHGRTHGYKESLIKVRKGKSKVNMVGPW
jgi:hypothetical protein